MISLTKADRTQIATLRALAAKWEPRIAKAFLEAVNSLEDSVDLDQLVQDIELYGQFYAEQMINEKALKPYYEPVAAVAVAATIDAGVTVADVVAPQIKTPSSTIGSFEVRFNSLNPSTQEYLKDASATLIQQITEETRMTVNQIVARGVQAGENPLTIAREIKQGIGLTARQEQAVFNYRTALESRDSAALQRALRDKRFDKTVQNAIANDVPLSKEQIDRMTERYRQKYIKYRSETIGRTEALKAANSGSDQLWRQQIDEGLIDERQVRREWVYSRDGRTRDAHVSIPRMNPDGVGINEPFKTPLGDLMYPHAPGGTAGNVINCRCTVFTRVLSAELVGL